MSVWDCDSCPHRSHFGACIEDGCSCGDTPEWRAGQELDLPDADEEVVA